LVPFTKRGAWHSGQASRSASAARRPLGSCLGGAFRKSTQSLTQAGMGSATGPDVTLDTSATVGQGALAGSTAATSSTMA
jgi:hypothetical protein